MKWLKEKVPYRFGATWCPELPSAWGAWYAEWDTTRNYCFSIGNLTLVFYVLQ